MAWFGRRMAEFLYRGEDPFSCLFHLASGFRTGRPVGYDAGQFRDLGEKRLISFVPMDGHV